MTSTPHNPVSVDAGLGSAATADPNSILAGLETPAVQPAGRRFLPNLPINRLRTRVQDAWDRATDTPEKHTRTVKRLRIAGIIAGVGLAVGLFFAFRPTPEPDYATAGMDEILDYTLLTDEFNKLPVEERMARIGQLIKRLKGMSSEDSALMASFAAGIAGKARQQLMENASRLMVDGWDKYAKDYGGVPEAERGEYLDKTFVDFTRMMEGLAGDPRDVSDEQRLKEVRRQAARDREAVKDPENAPPPEAVGRLFTFMNQGVGSYASPQQRQRGQQMMRDMMRHFRNQDPETGKPVAPGSTPPIDPPAPKPPEPSPTPAPGPR